MENFIVSARKYRPVTFDMVVGQQSITSTLKNAIRNNTLAQAFLFTGPRGVGKTTCARIMAKTINCFNPTPEMEACDQCESCVSFNRSNSFNIHELDAASNNSVDDIRNLVDQVRIPPQVGAYKIYIIDEVHMLSAAAFNAFLKTLEEPPSYAKFILATTEKHKIIPTILSRCQIFDFKRITLEDISKHLEYVSDKEGVTAEAEALAIIAQKADGALRDALSIFDQMVSFSGKNITYKDVIANLNVLDFEYYFSITENILQGNTSAVLLTLNEVIENGFDPQHFIHGMGSHLRSLLVSKNPETVRLMELSKSLQDRYAIQAKTCSMELLLEALDINNRCDINYRSSNNKRLHLEIALLQMCALSGQKAPKQQAAPSLAANRPAEPTTQKPLSQTPATPPTTVAAQAPKAAAQNTAPAPNYPTAQPAAQAASEPQHQVREANAGQMRGTRTISISDTEKKVEEKTEEPEPETRGAFDQQMLTTCWTGFVDGYKTVSPSFANAIGQFEPQLGENFEIKFTIENSLVANDKLNMSALYDHLKKAFNNNQLLLTPVISDKPRKLEAYTDKEKFEKMSELRPHLLQLKQELNLEASF